MTQPKPALKRCAVYTRKSSEEGLEQDFNSLHAQREACEAYIKSQQSEGWRLVETGYDDGGLSGGTVERPALQRLLADIAHGLVHTVVVYKVDRLTRSLADFAKLVEHFERHGASFVAVTQQFNTTTSMGRLTLNVLLSFAQFEREVTGERIRDKIAASKRKGMWMGGNLPLGYAVEDRKLVIVPSEAKTVRHIFQRYQQLGCVRRLKQELDRDGVLSNVRTSSTGRPRGGKPFSRGALYTLLANPIYIGEIRHKGVRYPGQQKPILEPALWHAVQQQLGTQGSARKGRSGKVSTSCLAGKIFDETGDRLTPSHTVKDGRRYRYYVSRRLLVGGRPSQHEGWRLPAPEIERVVATAAAKLLDNHATIMAVLEGVQLDVSATETVLKSAQIFKSRLRSDSERARALNALVERIDLQSDAIRLTLSLTALMPQGSSVQAGGKDLALTQTTPLRLARRGIEAKMIVDGVKDGAIPGVHAAFLRLVARSQGWFEALIIGHTRSIADLAKQEGLNERYVSSLLPLAFIAPPIIEAAVENRLPTDFPLTTMTNRPNIPIHWQDQIQTFGGLPKP
jgi:site-specific DNA recombinase